MVVFEPFDPRYRDDPYPVYRQLRREAPVQFAPEAGVYCISRYDDVQYVLRHAELFSSRAMLTTLKNPSIAKMSVARKLLGLARMVAQTRSNPLRLARAGNLITEDPPRHDAMRLVVNRGFTPKRIAAWEPRAREIVAERMQKLYAGEPFDLIEDLAVPLPVTIIAEMLGVETGRQRDFKRWSDALISGTSGSMRTDSQPERFLDSVGQLFGYLNRVVRKRRRSPGDDLVSVIVREQGGETGLSDGEVFQFVLLLLVAGNETTTNLIGNTVQALLDHPAELERVCADPSLVPALVEEGLRFDSPIQIGFRTATEDVEIAGTRIPRGSIVAPLLGSANRDEARFPDPDRLDVTRNVPGHLAFGFGVHHCLGSSLARLEARVALEAIVPELPRLTRRDQTRQWVDSFVVRGPTRLELVPAS